MTQRTFRLVIALCAIALTITWATNVAIAVYWSIFLAAILAVIDTSIWWVTHVSCGTVQKVFADAKGQTVVAVQVGRIRPKTIGVLTWAPKHVWGSARYRFSPGKVVQIVKRGPRFRAVPYGLVTDYNRPFSLQLACRVFASDLCNYWEEHPNDERVLALDVPPSECAAGSAS